MCEYSHTQEIRNACEYWGVCERTNAGFILKNSERPGAITEAFRSKGREIHASHMNSGLDVTEVLQDRPAQWDFSFSLNEERKSTSYNREQNQLVTNICEQHGAQVTEYTRTN